MKILQIFNRYLEYGGEEGVVRRVESALSESYDVRTFYGSTEAFLEQPFGKLRMPFAIRKNSSTLAELARWQRTYAFDVWQIHNVFPAISVAAYELAEELGVPVVQYLHNYRFGCPRATFFVENEPCTRCLGKATFGPALKRKCWKGSLPATGALAYALNRFHEKKMPNRIRGFFAISSCVKELHERIGFPGDKIHVLPHFLDAGAEPTSVPRHNGDVLFLGRITEEKGVDLLLKSWSQVESKGRKLRIVGDGPELLNMKELAGRLGLVDVIFEGFVASEDHDRLWSESAIFVAPSVWMEPFGMVVLESWRNGRPVVATDLGGFAEIISDGIDGWLAAPEPTAFAVALQQAMDAGDACAEMGRNGRATLEESFNRERWIDKCVEAYQNMNLLPA